MGAFLATRGLRQAGVQVGQTEMQRMTRIGEGAATEEDRAWMAQVEARRGQAPADMAGEAAARIGQVAPNIEKQAALMSQQIALGNKILPTVQKLDGTMSNTLTALTTSIGPSLGKIAGALEKLSSGGFWNKTSEKLADMLGDGQ